MHETESKQSLIEARAAEDDVAQFFAHSRVADFLIVLYAFAEHRDHSGDLGWFDEPGLQRRVDAAEHGRDPAMKFVVGDAGGSEDRFVKSPFDIGEDLRRLRAIGKRWVSFHAICHGLEIEYFVPQPFGQVHERLGQLHLLQHGHELAAAAEDQVVPAGGSLEAAS